MTACHSPSCSKIQLLSGLGCQVSNSLLPASVSGSWFHLPVAWSLTFLKSFGLLTVTSKLNSILWSKGISPLSAVRTAETVSVLRSQVMVNSLDTSRSLSVLSTSL